MVFLHSFPRQGLCASTCLWIYIDRKYVCLAGAALPHAQSPKLTCPDYVPYTMWHGSEPSLSSVLSRSRSTYQHELLVGNLAGIPVAQQHGADDDNVPAFHGRLMHELLGQAGWPSEYEELPGTKV